MKYNLFHDSNILSRTNKGARGRIYLIFPQLKLINQTIKKNKGVFKKARKFYSTSNVYDFP